ncbi:MAG: O-antigen ligase family protein [Deltaproteobacteria bacterium]|nr:O-antigen ligase family protein [Deltaproteobacteria bacterium]
MAILQQPKDFFRLLGPLFVVFMAFGGVFARGLVNISYGALLAWGIGWLIFQRRKTLFSAPTLPKIPLLGIAIYLLILLLTASVGINPKRSFAYISNVAYLLLIFPVVFLALKESPQVLPKLILLAYGLGLIVVGLHTFWQANCTLSCIRAKSSIGIIELGAILGQLPPIILGALALAYRAREYKKVAFFALALALAYVAFRNNCSRIALIAAPFLCLLMLFALRNCFQKIVQLIVVAIVLLGIVSVGLDSTIQNRMKAMLDFSGKTPSNLVRTVHWKKGFQVFQEHPLLGVGPDAVPNVRFEELPPLERSTPHREYHHAHHIFLTVLAESGILGLLGFLSLHLLPLYYLWPSFKSQDLKVRFWAFGALIMTLQLFLNGMVDHVFALKALTYIYWTVTAVAIFRQKIPAKQGPTSAPAT